MISWKEKKKERFVIPQKRKKKEKIKFIKMTKKFNLNDF